MAGIDAVRSYCGWHIAPSTSETVSVEGDGGRVLLLPSLLITDTTEVRDESGNVVTGWKVRENGIARGYWLAEELYEFDITHGHETMPPELQDIINQVDAAGANSVALRSVTKGPFSESYDLANAPLSVRAVLDRYRLPARP